MGASPSFKAVRTVVNALIFIHHVRYSLFLHNLHHDKLFKVLTTYRVLELVLRGRFKYGVLYALTFVKFQIKDSAAHTPFQHLADYLRYGMIGARLPPDCRRTLAQQFGKNGLWQRHKAELACHKTYGPIFGTRGLTRMIVWVCSPALVETVMTDKDSFPTRGDTGFTNLTKFGLLGLPSGDLHSKHRKVVGGFMSNKWLNQYSKFIQEETQVLVDKWSKLCAANRTSGTPEETNVTYDLSMMTLEVIMKVCFGNNGEDINQQLVRQEDNHLNQGLDYALKEITISTGVPFLKYLPSPFRWKFFSLYERLFERAAKKCEELAKDPEAPLMIYSALREARNEDGSKWDDKEIFDEINTVRGAGHETTSNTLSWVLYLLALNPDCVEKLYLEVDNVVKGDTVTFEESKQLQYTHMILLETLRVYPTVPSFPREAAYDVRLGGYTIPKGSMVFVSQNSLNQSPQLWKDPERFCPERFGKGNLPELRPTKPLGIPGGPEFGFLPFGAGQRTCIGQRLAIQEGVQMLGSIAKNFTWKLSRPNEPVAEVADITMGPKEGLYLEFELRKKFNHF